MVRKFAWCIVLFGLQILLCDHVSFFRLFCVVVVFPPKHLTLQYFIYSLCYFVVLTLFSHYTPIYIAFHCYADKGSALIDSTPLSKPVLKAVPSKLSSHGYFKIIMKVTLDTQWVFRLQWSTKKASNNIQIHVRQYKTSARWLSCVRFKHSPLRFMSLHQSADRVARLDLVSLYTEKRKIRCLSKQPAVCLVRNVQV
jgi:hypothetical protein